MIVARRLGALFGGVLLACAPASAGAQALMGMQRIADGVYVYTESDGGRIPPRSAR